MEKQRNYFSVGNYIYPIGFETYGYLVEFLAKDMQRVGII